MQRFFLAGSILAAVFAAPAIAAPETYDLDSEHTFPGFEINHLGFSVMHGSFLTTEGTLVYDQEKHTGKVSATIQASSIATGFTKRDAHLRSPDFFGVDKFPTLSFQSEEFQLDPAKAVPVGGQLTMLGVTKPVTLSVMPTKCAMRPDKKFVCGAIVSGALKRSDWGMTTFLPFIGDDVKLQIEVEAIKK
jgi:polyisoprenoid-binding protein YceI